MHIGSRGFISINKEILLFNCFSYYMYVHVCMWVGTKAQAHIPVCGVKNWHLVFFLQATHLIQVVPLVKLVRATPRMPISIPGILELQALYVRGSHLNSTPYIFPEGHSYTEPPPQHPYVLIVLRPTFELLIHGRSWSLQLRRNFTLPLPERGAFNCTSPHRSKGKGISNIWEHKQCILGAPFSSQLDQHLQKQVRLWLLWEYQSDDKNFNPKRWIFRDESSPAVYTQQLIFCMKVHLISNHRDIFHLNQISKS